MSGGDLLGGGSGERPFVTAVKVISILFLSASLIVGAFYVAIYARKWKKKRGTYYCYSLSPAINFYAPIAGIPFAPPIATPS